jgi:hypothetical protein
MQPSKRDPSQPPEKWWNEHFLEGDENSPANLITKILSNSGRLIGWDPERFEKKVLESISKAKGYPVQDFSVLEGDRKYIFDFPEVLAHLITNKLFQWRVSPPQGESGSKKITLLDLGSQPTLELSCEEINTMKQTPLYTLLLKNAIWQRDNYLVGKEYADLRQNMRESDAKSITANITPDTLEENFKYPPNTMLLHRIPANDTSLGSIQLSTLTSNLLPSPIVLNYTRPLVTQLLLPTLYPMALRSTTNLIPRFQANLDDIVKEQVIWILSHRQWRERIKASTKGFLTTTYVDATGEK